MKIGFYLAYQPIISLSFVGEGLGRYMARLFDCLIKDGHEILIACPKWLIHSIEELVEENNISTERIKIITPSGESVLWKMIKFRYTNIPKPKKSVKNVLLNASYKTSEHFVDLLVAVKNKILLFVIYLLSTVIGIALSPFALIFGIVLFIIKLFCKLFKLNISDLSPKKLIKKILSLNGRLNKIFSFLLSNGLARDLPEKLRRDAAKDIIRKINHMKKPADIWFSPMAYWPEFSKINGIKAACFPDITPAFFPIGFSSLNLIKSVNNIRNVVKKVKYFIVYSDYQRKQVLSSNLGVDIEYIKTIGISSFVNNTLEDVDTNKYFGTYYHDSVIKFSRQKLSLLSNHSLPEVKEYLFGVSGKFLFDDTKYIFYASQARPHKNIINLIKAYEYLLRKKEVTFKLFLTCNPNTIPELREYIFSHRLQFDVLCFSGVSNQLLAALYTCAELVVNPTLYEGGFPLTFSEGMAVGVPSVMGKIPQVMEVIQGYGLTEYMFDPYNYIDIADKIMLGLNNKTTLYNLETPLFEKLVKEKNNIGKEYVNAFKYFIDMEKSQRYKKNCETV